MGRIIVTDPRRSNPATEIERSGSVKPETVTENVSESINFKTFTYYFFESRREDAMARKRDQHTVGTPEKLRGQQTGFAGNADKNREEMKETPALRGKRKLANKMFADASQQHIGGDSITPTTNSPSVPAMNQKGQGGQGGERIFKQRLSRKRSR